MPNDPRTPTEPQTILLTGAKGFLGQHLLRRLTGWSGTLIATDTAFDGPLDSPITAVTADLTDSGQFEAIFEQYRPDAVIHMAAAGVRNPDLPLETALSVNLMGSLMLYQLAMKYGVKRFIHTGTSYEYGDRGDANHADPISMYAASKAAAWNFARMYYRTQGLPIVGLRLFQVYGPNLPGGVIGAALDAARKGIPFDTTLGQQKRDWVYVDDVLEAYLTALTASGIEGRAFDIGTGQTHSLKSILEQVAEITGTLKPRYGTLPYRDGEVFDLAADTGPARDLLGWQSTTSLEVGLRRTITQSIQPG